MKYKHIFIVFSFVLLTALVACGPTPATLAPSPLGAGQINNNSSGPIQLAATPIPSPYYTKPAPSGCVQFGCAYPAVCDQATGQCVINNSGQGPATLAPVPLGAGQIANNPSGPIQLAPTATTLPPQNAVCIPPVPSISNVNSFCANQAKGLGGATFHYAPTLDALDYPTGNSVNCDLGNPGKGACAGPQSTQFQEFICTQCGLGSPNQGAVTCALGSTKNASGLCLPPSDPNKYYDLCPSGSDWDNSKQACVDEKTAAFNPQCPPGYPYFLPGNYACASQPWQVVYDCQSFPLQLGTCAVIKKAPGTVSCQPPAGGCPVNPLNGGPGTWNQATCSCK